MDFGDILKRIAEDDDAPPHIKALLEAKNKMMKNQKDEFRNNKFMSQFVSEREDRILSMNKINKYLGYELYTHKVTPEDLSLATRLLCFEGRRREEIDAQSQKWVSELLDETGSSDPEL